LLCNPWGEKDSISNGMVEEIMSDCYDDAPHGTGFEPTLCDGDITNNEWFGEGVCLLDTMTKDQVIYAIQHNPKARDDLRRVTTCDELHDLLDKVPLLPTVQEDDEAQKRMNQTDCLPFYNVFRGNCSDR